MVDAPNMHMRINRTSVVTDDKYYTCMGTVDIFADNKLGLLAFRKNISFFAIDMDRLWLDDPELSAEVNTRFEGGHCFLPCMMVRPSIDRLIDRLTD